MPAKATARQRAEMILKVRSGQMTVTAAAAALGVSRKTYYQWEARGLSAMLAQLEDKEPGRPALEHNRQQAALQTKMAQMRQQIESLTQTAELRALLRTMEAKGAKKNRRRSSSSSP